MAGVRTISRFISATVIVALVTVDVLAVCCAALGAPATRGLMVADGACVIDSHSSYAPASPSAGALKTAVALSATPSVQLLFGVAGESEVQDALDSAELPDPPDPRHGRVRA